MVVVVVVDVENDDVVIVIVVAVVVEQLFNKKIECVCMCEFNVFYSCRI